MIPEIRMKLQNAGILVIDGEFDFHYQTNTFVQLPDGRTLAYYDYMHEIPDTITDGEEISLGEQAIPPGEVILTEDANGQGSDGIIWDGDNPNVTYNGTPTLIAPAVLALIIFLIKLIAIFVVLYILMSKWLHPCGSTETTDVDQCMKVIEYPDCSTITINSCNTDAQGNYEPEVVNRTGAPGTDLMQWVVYGAVAIGAVAVIYMLLKHSSSEKYYEQYPKDRPAPRQGYLSRKWYGVD